MFEEHIFSSRENGIQLPSLTISLQEFDMLANYGYSDASGNYFINIDTDKCDACGACVDACPSKVFIIVNEDPNDPMNDEPLSIVAPDKRKNIKYECWQCKSSIVSPVLPCITACVTEAISHSW